MSTQSNTDNAAQANQATTPPADNGESSPRTDFATLGAILGIAATLVVGVFAALGVSDDLLARMVRNSPSESRNMLIVAIIAMVTAAVITGIRRIPNGYLAVPVVVLGVALVWATEIAADSQGERDMPSVTLSVARTDDGLTVTSKSSGSGLRSDERMLTRVAAILRPLKVEEQPDPDPRREGRSTSELREVSSQQCQQPYLHLADPSAARLLSWTETGPTAKGESIAEHTMPIPTTARYVCAYVILSDIPDESGNYQEPIARNFAIVDLTGLAP